MSTITEDEKCLNTGRDSKRFFVVKLVLEPKRIHLNHQMTPGFTLVGDWMKICVIIALNANPSHATTATSTTLSIYNGSYIIQPFFREEDVGAMSSKVNHPQYRNRSHHRGYIRKRSSSISNSISSNQTRNRQHGVAEHNSDRRRSMGDVRRGTDKLVNIGTGYQRVGEFDGSTLEPFRHQGYISNLDSSRLPQLGAAPSAGERVARSMTATPSQSLTRCPTLLTFSK